MRFQPQPALAVNYRAPIITDASKWPSTESLNAPVFKAGSECAAAGVPACGSEMIKSRQARRPAVTQLPAGASAQSDQWKQCRCNRHDSEANHAHDGKHH